MSPKPYREILDSVAGDHMPEGLNLYPRIAAQLERKPLMQTLRARPVLALVIVVLALLMLSGVAYAVGNLLGYIPGVGIIDRSAPLRVLSEPVSQTRDGITVTVKSAILTSDKTLVVYSIENGPPPLPEPEMTPLHCSDFNVLLRLPDGSSLAITRGEGFPAETTGIYGPIPPGVEQAGFVLPCIPNARQGTLPEDWELPLRFVPAPPGMALPVVELATPTPALTEPTGAAPAAQTVVIEKALQVGDKLILVGVLTSNLPAGTWLQLEGDMRISDAGGNEIPYEIPGETFDHPTYTDPNAVPWVAQIANEHLSYPLTFTFSGVTFSQPDPQATAEIEFDVDSDFKPGQGWQINRDVVIAGHQVRLVSVALDSRGQPVPSYTFLFECDPEVVGLDLEIPGYTLGGYGGGGGAPGTFSIIQSYTEPLAGKVKIILSHLMAVSGRQTWQAHWSP